MKTIIVTTVAENFEVISVESSWAAAENVIRKFFADNGITEDDGETIFAVEADEAETHVLKAALELLSDKTDEESVAHADTIRKLLSV